MKRDSEPASGEERAALASLYERWRKPLLRLFQGRCGNRQQAEDATQDLFVRLAASGKPLASAEEKPYLSTMARSIAIDRWRRSGGDNAPELVPLDCASEELETLQTAERLSPLETASRRQRIDRLNAAVAELPERQRQAFLLNRIDGLSHDEVAAAMGISARMVAKHLSRAMAYCQLRVKYASLQQMQSLHVHDDSGEDGAAEREDPR